ncbi:MAG: ABC transporter substrate-binding protein [Rhizobiaceae bacterium]|nr:ABC transporter substrate-binding protein [Rhizobiaceae bacterium]MCV0404818.1 ABC transporter substrate-binding protein [Rhizobiaceae bacterium]
MAVSAHVSDLIKPGIAAFIAAALAYPAPAHAAGPRGVMSLNVCTDQLVLSLAEPADIVSLSELSVDPTLSFMAGEAASYPKNAGLAEEVLAARPSVVVTGTYSLHNTTALLSGLGTRVEEFPYQQSIDTIPADIRRMGTILGKEDEAEALARDFEAELATARADLGGVHPRAIVFGPNGVVAGAGTLQHTVLEAAGFRNLAAERGMTGMAPYPLELLVADRPDLVLLSAPMTDAPALADRIARHPAIAASGAALPSGAIPAGSWDCGGPFTLEALRALRSIRDGLLAEDQPSK